MSEYIYIQPQLVGGLENYSTAYYSDFVACPTVKAACNHGWKVLDHDDFWVGEKVNGVVVRLYNSDGELREHEDLAEELTGVNAEFGSGEVVDTFACNRCGLTYNAADQENQEPQPICDEFCLKIYEFEAHDEDDEDDEEASK